MPRSPTIGWPRSIAWLRKSIEQLWVGHFDVWTQEGLIMFRQGLMLNGALATTHQCEALLKAALEACERYYQAFQFVVMGRQGQPRGPGLDHV